jgi:hypothetical protein
VETFADAIEDMRPDEALNACTGGTAALRLLWNRLSGSARGLDLATAEAIQELIEEAALAAHLNFIHAVAESN